MSKTVGIAIAVAILALAAAVALPALIQGDAEDSYQLMAAGGNMYRIDTVTGDTWISVDGGDWDWVGEPDEAAPETAGLRAHPQRKYASTFRREPVPAASASTSCRRPSAGSSRREARWRP